MTSRRILPVAFVLILICACTMQEGGALFGGSGQTGSLTLSITDKPYPYDMIEEASITITEIEVRRTEVQDANNDDDDGDDDDGDENEAEDDDDGDSPEESQDADRGASGDVEVEVEDGPDELDVDAEDGETGDDDDDGGLAADGADQESSWVTILSEARTIDLTDLRNGRTDLLAQMAIPAGGYRKMRLMVTEGFVRLNDGREFPLTVPSGPQTGIKLHFNFTVEPDQETVLLLDVDISRAFLAIPSGHIDDPATITGFMFLPSHAMRLINVLEAGTVAGAVTDESQAPLANVAVTAYDQNGEEVANTATDPDGTYLLVGLPTGMYRVEFSAMGFEDASVENVSVNAGDAVGGVNATLMSAGG